MAAAFILPVADRAYILIQVLYAALGAYALTRAFSPRHLDLDYGLIGTFSALFSLACIAVYPQDAPLLAATAFIALIGLTIPVLASSLRAITKTYRPILVIFPSSKNRSGGGCTAPIRRRSPGERDPAARWTKALQGRVRSPPSTR